MGKVKQILAVLPDGSSIEVNEGSGEDIIHIQHERFRIELSVQEYREISANIICAAMELRRRKSLQDAAFF